MWFTNLTISCSYDLTSHNCDTFLLLWFYIIIENLYLQCYFSYISQMQIYFSINLFTHIIFHNCDLSSSLLWFHHSQCDFLSNCDFVLQFYNVSQIWLVVSCSYTLDSHLNNILQENVFWKKQSLSFSSLWSDMDRLDEHSSLVCIQDISLPRAVWPQAHLREAI